MQNLKITAIAAGIVLSMLACNDSALQNKDLSITELHSPEGIIADEAKTEDQFQSVPPPPKQEPPKKESSLIQQSFEKKIVKNANLDISIKDFTQYSSYLKNEVKNAGAFIASEEQMETDYFIQNDIVIKVPVEAFDKLVTQLLAPTEKIFQKNITAEDVTTQVVDTRARLDAKKAVRFRYIELLKQAKNLEEILQVQNEINAIQETIEATSSKLEHLQHTSAYSTIRLMYKQILNQDFLNTENTFAYRIGQSFKSGWQWIKEFMIGFVAIWPLFIIGLLTWMLVRRIKKPKV